MIRGRVDENRMSLVPVTVFDASGGLHELTAMIDTGFSGYLSLAGKMIERFALPFARNSIFILADGSSVEFPLYSATVLWHDEERTVLVVSGDDDPIMGMSLLDGSTLFMDATPGGIIRIEPR